MPGPLRFRLRSPKLTLVGGLLAVMLVASPALAGSQLAATSYQPDGWVRFYSEKWDGSKRVDPSAWKGDGIYNTTGRYQTAKRVVGPQSSDGQWAYDLVFQVTIENDGATDRFRVGASGTGDWRVKYFRGTTNITSAVVNGTYRTPYLGYGERLVLKVKVVGLGYADLKMTRLLTITSLGNPNRVDAVRIKGLNEICGC